MTRKRVFLPEYKSIKSTAGTLAQYSKWVLFIITLAHRFINEFLQISQSQLKETVNWLELQIY